MGEPAGAWDTYSAGEDLLDFMEALNIKSFEDVPDKELRRRARKYHHQTAEQVGQAGCLLARHGRAELEPALVVA